MSAPHSGVGQREGSVAGEARVKVSLREGVIELEGPQDFVEKQVEAFGDLIRASLEGWREPLPEENRRTPAENQERHERQDAAAEPGNNPYPAVFAIKDQKVQILADQIPGTNDKEKTVNAGLLTAFGGTPRKQTAQLTVPGRADAKKVADALANPVEGAAA